VFYRVCFVCFILGGFVGVLGGFGWWGWFGVWWFGCRWRVGGGGGCGLGGGVLVVFCVVWVCG